MNVVRGCVWILIGAMASLAHAASPLLPPLTDPLTLTSSFGEFRSGHYHGGLDFSTGGEVGRPVQAPADGWVLRVRCSGVGYGRALYLRLVDGRTVVFAHLDRFQPAIAAALRAEQDRQAAYEVDFSLDEGVLPFRAGDIVAYTGESGAGPPHLHAEVRTDPSASVAENPLHHGWVVEDDVAPSVTRLRVIPSRPGSLVDGGLSPVTLSLDREPTVTITDGVRLWVETLDRAVAGGTRLGPYRVQAALDDTVFLDIVWDRFDWNHPREVEWTFDAASARAHNQRWVALEPPPRGNQPLAQGMGTDERTALLSPGPHRLRIEVTDGAGNRTGRTVRLVKSQESLPRVLGPAVPTLQVISRETVLEVRGPGTDGGPALSLISPTGRALPWTGPQWNYLGGRVGRLGPPQPPEVGWWQIVGEGSSPVSGALWMGGRTDSARLELEGFSATFSSGSVYGPMWITAQREGMPSTPTDAPDLVPVSPVIALGPWAHPLRAPVEVRLQLVDGVPPDKVALFSRTEGRWAFEGAEVEQGHLTARITALEAVALFLDETPPSVSLELGAGGSRPRIAARIVDRGVGVTWRSLTLTVDGVPVIAEWDPEASRLIAHLRTDLAPGNHLVEAIVADRLGNTARASETLRVE